jgi:hypothetical protein
MAKKEKQDGEQRRRIAGGYIRVARRLKDSSIWSQDPHHLRLWTYLLLSARWDEKPIQKGGVTIGRGQVLKSFRRIADENEWTENRALKKWSPSRVKRMLDWLSENEMVSLHGTELGTLITISNFNDYQDPETYRLELGTEPGTQSERSRNNRKKGKKGKKEKAPEDISCEIQERRSRYTPEQLQVIDSAIAAFQSTRKRGRITDSVILAEFVWWEDHDSGSVVEGLRTYVAKGYAAEGKGEKYARGIIRSSKGASARPQRSKNTGFPEVEDSKAEYLEARRAQSAELSR